MVNSFLMLGSSYGRNKKMNILFIALWFFYLLIGSNINTGLIFLIMNLMAFSLVLLLGKIFKGKYSNKLVSVLSIVIWSITIDIICFFLYPQFTMGQNILMYIGNGLLFNSKYVIYNIVVVGLLSFAPVLSKNLLKKAKNQKAFVS